MLSHDWQAEELVVARAEAQQLSSAQAALQGAFVRLQTDMDCLRMRPTARHAHWLQAHQHSFAVRTASEDVHVLKGSACKQDLLCWTCLCKVW
jgi:ferredoxin